MGERRPKPAEVLVFLDFDGVLHPRSGNRLFDPACLAWLEKLAEEFPGLRFVLSTTWRENKPLEGLKLLLGRIGSKVIGITPVIDEPFLKGVRYHEVMAYIASQDYTGEWLALDDTPGLYLGHLENVVLTDPKTGITASVFATLRFRVIQLLTR